MNKAERPPQAERILAAETLPGAVVDTAISNLGDIEPGKALILQAAADCFMKSGFNATSIDDVAAHLNATKGRVYHYYRSKADLFFDVHRTGMRINIGTIRPISIGPEPIEKRYELMCRQHLSNMLHSISFQRVVMQGVEMHLAGRTTPGEREKLQLLMREREEYEQFFQTVLVEGRKAGSFVFNSPSLASKAVLAILNNPVIWYRRRENESVEERLAIIDEFTRYAQNCVCAEIPASS